MNLLPKNNPNTIIIIIINPEIINFKKLNRKTNKRL